MVFCVLEKLINSLHNKLIMQSKIALVVSEADVASCLILKKLEELCSAKTGKPSPEWAQLYKFKEDIIHVDLSRVAEQNCVFLSRHKSEAGTKSLTVHHLGNFGKEAPVGGVPEKLCGCLPQLEAAYLRALAKKNEETALVNEGFVVSLEATHHGPYHSEKNCLFIELGSSEKEWSNEKAAQILAETVLEETPNLISVNSQNKNGNKDVVVVGFGGGHYAPDFTKLVLRQPYAFGHICAKYALEYLNESTFNQMIEKSGAKEIVLDWKGLKDGKEKVMTFSEKSGLPIKRVQDLLGY